MIKQMYGEGNCFRSEDSSAELSPFYCQGYKQYTAFDVLFWKQESSCNKVLKNLTIYFQFKGGGGTIYF
jgi:hypothetical protein